MKLSEIENGDIVRIKSIFGEKQHRLVYFDVHDKDSIHEALDKIDSIANDHMLALVRKILNPLGVDLTWAERSSDCFRIRFQQRHQPLVDYLVSYRSSKTNAISYHGWGKLDNFKLTTRIGFFPILLNKILESSVHQAYMQCINTSACGMDMQKRRMSGSNSPMAEFRLIYLTHNLEALFKKHFKNHDYVWESMSILLKAVRIADTNASMIEPVTFADIRKLAAVPSDKYINCPIKSTIYIAASNFAAQGEAMNTSSIPREKRIEILTERLEDIARKRQELEEKISTFEDELRSLSNKSTEIASRLESLNKYPDDEAELADLIMTALRDPDATTESLAEILRGYSGTNKL